MSRRCTFNGCHAPELSCGYGESDYEECTHWQAGGKSEATTSSVIEENAPLAGFRFPWTGNAMGIEDMAYLVGSAKARVLTLAGAADAGKTSLLAAFYLLIARGIFPDDVRFAGSLTLEGWENISNNLRWSAKNGPSFPPHTSSGVGRRPGLLHLTFDLLDQRCELLSADAPGEWFSDWATNKLHPLAEGARWLAGCTDVFLVIADSEALSGEERGLSRKALIDLLRRIGDERNDCPVALVWTKCDLAVSDEIETAVHEAAGRSLGSYPIFRVSMFSAANDQTRNQGQGILELLHWILTVKPEGRECPDDEQPERTLLRVCGGI